MTDLDDLIARLRSPHEYAIQMLVAGCPKELFDVWLEAAAALEAMRDEVARKDAALQEIADTHNDQWQAGRIARAALAPKE